MKNNDYNNKMKSSDKKHKIVNIKIKLIFSSVKNNLFFTNKLKQKKFIRYNEQICEEKFFRNHPKKCFYKKMSS